MTEQEYEQGVYEIKIVNIKSGKELYNFGFHGYMHTEERTKILNYVKRFRNRWLDVKIVKAECAVPLHVVAFSFQQFIEYWNSCVFEHFPRTLDNNGKLVYKE